MIIRSIELNGYNAFSINNLNNFKLTMTSPIQVIIGTNGCGKSSLARECTPLPAVRTAYSKNGMKRIVIEHDHSEYVLTSDFSNTSSPHSFKKDDEELNVSGNTSIQEDLVRTYLGYTPIIHDLSQGNIDFASMSPSAKKNLLVSINPYNVDLIVDINKKCNTHLRGLVATLKMLHQRKDELLPKILSEDALQSLISSKACIAEDIDTLNMNIYAIEPHIKYLKDLDKEYAYRIMTSVDIKDTYDAIRNMSHDYNENIYGTEEYAAGCIGLVPDEDFDKEIETLERNKSVEINKRDTVEESLRGIVDDIERYRQLLSDKKDHDGDVSLTDRIKDVKDSLAVLKDKVIEDPLSERDIAVWETIDGDVFSVLKLLTDYRGTIKSNEEFRQIENEKFQLENNVTNQRKYIETLKSQYADAYKQFEQLEEIGSVESCKDHDCVLLPAYLESHTNKKAILDALSKNLKVETKKADEWIVRVEELSKEKELLDKYRPHLLTLKGLITRFPLIASISKESLKDVLNTDPLSIHQKIIYNVDVSECTHKYHQYQTELSILESKLKSQADASSINTSVLENLYNDLVKKRTDLITKREKIEASIASIDRYIKIRQQYKKYVKFGFDIEETYDQSITKAQISHAIKHYSQIHRALTNVKNNYLEKLAIATHTINEQDRLKARYEEEVNVNLKTLEKEYEEYSFLEKATSPNSGLPHQYLVIVLNSLITNMNYFIKMVFNYKFEICALSLDKPVDFKFSAIVGNNEVPVPDIATCSTAQKEMINLAFKLAAMIQLKSTDYPIVLDEIGRTFDEYHKQKLLEFVRNIIDTKTIAQLVLINHHAVLHEGLQGSEVLVLDDTNVVVPSVYNEHVEMS